VSGTSIGSSRLQRETFRTSRLLDFASPKELIAQTGHQPAQWPLVVIKEAIDNEIDACEERGIVPEITVVANAIGITVIGNGPGIPSETVKRVLDFTVRVSSREAYVSPTRGAQGNALKTIIAMPFVLDGQKGKVEIEARGVRHEIQFEVDHVRQTPVIHHEQEKSKVKVGTVVRVPWRNLSKAEFVDETDDDNESFDEDDETNENSPRSIPDAKSRFLQFASDFAWLNPHLALTIDWFGKRTSIEATDPGWSKWKPSDPTSPHWYTQAHLQRLIGAYLSHDADNSSERTVRDFISEFRGLGATAKQKKVRDATGLARAPLSTLISGNGFEGARVASLLASMQQQSSPVKPMLLGIIGKQHLERRFQAAGCEMETFEYRRIMETEDGIPWIIEVGFAWCPDAKERRLVVGINWSATIINPFRELGEFGVSLDTVLTEARVGRNDPVIVFMHLAHPRVEFTDRGKSAAVMSMTKSESMMSALISVTGKWTKQRQREERERSAVQNRRFAMLRMHKVTIKEAAWRAIPEAYMKASANNTLPANARQIMYAARPVIARMADHELRGTFDKYFTQTLLPDFIGQMKPAWAGRVVFDARGHFTEPHTEREIGLGTLEVREYLASVHNHKVNDPDFDLIEKHYPTAGPKSRFGAILFLEKEGFAPLLKAVHLAERYDIATMSTKGMSVTASRELIEELGATYKVPILVLHDFDISGFTIFGTLRSSTRRFTYDRKFKVIDLGLRLADIEGLEREDVYISSSAKTTATLRRHGATKKEIEILIDQGRRVELNALASDQLIDLIERKLAEHGISKVIPAEKVLAEAYRRMHRQAVIQAEIDKLVADLDEDDIGIPTGLRHYIEKEIAANPMQSWDELLREIVSESAEP